MQNPRSDTMLALIILVALSISSVNAVAPSPAPAMDVPATDCMTLILGMADCVPYVEKGSNVTKPDKACCPELKALLDTNATCLCQLLGNNTDLPVPPLDMDRALNLPNVCKVKTPPVSTCALIGIPVAGAPGGSTTLTGAPISSSVMSPMGEEAGGPSGSTNGVSITSANSYLFSLISALTIALFTL